MYKKISRILNPKPPIFLEHQHSFLGFVNAQVFYNLKNYYKLKTQYVSGKYLTVCRE